MPANGRKLGSWNFIKHYIWFSKRKEMFGTKTNTFSLAEIIAKLMDIKYLITILMSGGALLFSFLNYRRSRKFENENHLYKSKVEIYSKIQDEMIKLTSSLRSDYYEIEKNVKDSKVLDIKLLNDKAHKIVSMCDSYLDFVLQNSLLMPEDVFISFDDFFKHIYNSDLPNTDFEDMDLDKVLNSFKEVFNSIIDEAEKVSYLLRNDLQIEKLNVSLYKRLR